MKFFWCFLILTLAFIFSCKKKEFPATETDTTADFYFSGQVDGTPVEINSGKNNYYMYSSYMQGADGIYNFVADLKQSNCDNCPNSLQIKINDFKISQANEYAQIDSSLVPKSYPLTANYFYAVQFKSIYNKPVSGYYWNFGDGTKSTQADPVHTYTAMGNYNVNLKIIGTNFCEQYVKNLEKISYPVRNCRISVVRDSAKTVKCSADIQGVGPYRQHWDFGDGVSSSLIAPTHTYSVAGTYPISLRVIDGNNDTTYAKYNNATTTQPMPCLTNYSVTSITPVINPLAFSNVTITWTDGTGTIYTSNNALQPTASFFDIVAVENYDNNEKGETTKKIKVRFKCNVYNGTAVKTLNNVEAVIAVSYK